MSYDPKCEDLARHFLGEDAKRSDVEELSECLQVVCEDFLDSLAQEADDTPPTLTEAMHPEKWKGVR